MFCNLDNNYKYFGIYMFDDSNFNIKEFLSQTPRLPDRAIKLDDCSTILLWQSFELLGVVQGEENVFWGDACEGNSKMKMPLHLLFDFFTHAEIFFPTGILVSIIPRHLSHSPHLSCEVPAINAHDFSCSHLSQQGMRIFIEDSIDLTLILSQHKQFVNIEFNDIKLNPNVFLNYCTNGIKRLRTLLSFINDVESYKQWYPDVHRSYHLFHYWYWTIRDNGNIYDSCDDIDRINSFWYQPWFIENRCWEKTNPLGLLYIHVDDLNCKAIFDYEPRFKRRIAIECIDKQTKKLILRLVENDESLTNISILPYNSQHHLHLLPSEYSSSWRYYIKNNASSSIILLKSSIYGDYPIEINVNENGGNVQDANCQAADKDRIEIVTP